MRTGNRGHIEADVNVGLKGDPVLKKKGWVPIELVLELLEQEKPTRFVLEKGIMSAPERKQIKPVNIEDVKQMILATVKQIAHDYEHGFAVAPTDQPCKYCAYKLYCPKKWG